MALRETNVLQIADLLRGTAATEPKACLLIGAGVSYSGGIGLANDFVRQIKAEFPAIHDAVCKSCLDGTQPTYAQCMAALPPAKQVQLVRKDIDAAKINWAHIGIARMERASLVDTILTPNFDPLASRACALFNRFPAIYDLAGLRDNSSNHINFDRSFVKGSAIFHLHGQHTGFLLLNTKEKLEDQAKRIRPVLDAVMKGKPVIIVGYSGNNDPLIDQIAALAPFNHGLFWICHDNADPARNVCDKLLSLEDCYVVRNAPSDNFFTELANALELEAPEFLATPFVHMLNVLDTLRPFSDVGEGSGNDLLAQARAQLVSAGEAHAKARPERAEIVTLMATGRFEDVWKKYGSRLEALDLDDQDLVAWAAIMIGDALSKQARIKQGEAADALFAAAGEKYAAALTIKPNMPETLTNWGNVLFNRAGMKQGDAADKLFAEASEKYAAALAIRPDLHEALINWGVALSNQAKIKQDEAADALFAAAGEKYAAVLAIKPDVAEAMANWGVLLSDHADIKQGEAAAELLAKASEKYAAALAMRSDMPDVLHNWGVALSKQAKIKQGEAADELFADAGEKYAAALAIKPDMPETLTDWAIALSAQANEKQGEVADKLFAKASEKYAAALAIKPDLHEALTNWGSALLARANKKEGEAADELFAEAREKYAAALTIKHDLPETLTHWGSALSAQANKKQGDVADALFAEASDKYAAALAIKPDTPETLTDWGIALSNQANSKEGETADALFAAASEKYVAALAIKPDMHNALNNLGNVLLGQAKLKHGEAADALFAEAGERYAAALAIKPDKHLALSNWGAALSDQAKLKHGEAADALFAEAGEKFAAALAIKPNVLDTLNNWGVMLSIQGKLKQGAAAKILFAAAVEKLLLGEQHAPGCCAYNLACVHGLLGDATSASQWLTTFFRYNIKTTNCSDISDDNDFDPVRNSAEFIYVLKEFCS